MVQFAGMILHECISQDVGKKSVKTQITTNPIAHGQLNALIVSFAIIPFHRFCFKPSDQNHANLNDLSVL